MLSSAALVWLCVAAACCCMCRPQRAAGMIQEEFDVSKHRKHEARSGKLKAQEARIRKSQHRMDGLNKLHSMGGVRFCNSSLAYPDHYISVLQYNDSVIDMTHEERKGKAKCSFLGALCATEAVEHSLVGKYLLANDSVLETGARYGTTSCSIAHRLGNSGKLISVEPDHRVWNLLDENRRLHHCNFWLMRGVIGDRPAAISGTFYSTRSMASNVTQKGIMSDRCPQVNANSRNIGTTLAAARQHYTLEEIQRVTNITLSALLIDCEGCIESMFAGNSQTLSAVLSKINTIILEADMPVGAPDCEHNCVDYSKWVSLFESIGLKVVFKQQDPMYTRIYHYVFRR